VPQEASGLCLAQTVAQWVSAARSSGGRTVAAKVTGQAAVYLREDFVYLFIFYNISNVGILTTIFPSCFQAYTCECFNFSSCNFKMSVTKYRAHFFL
jgi:hypothetical protein